MSGTISTTPIFLLAVAGGLPAKRIEMKQLRADFAHLLVIEYVV